MKHFIDRITGFPSSYWVLVLTSASKHFARSIGWSSYGIYLSNRFDLGYDEVKSLFVLIISASVVGTLIGGLVNDRIGRKPVIIFSLLTGALCSFLMIAIQTILIFNVAAVIFEFLISLANPSYDTVITDQVEEDSRTIGFAFPLIASSISWFIAPIMGGYLVRAYGGWSLFLITGLILFSASLIAHIGLMETLPISMEEREQINLKQAFFGYWRVILDKKFLGFLLASALLVRYDIQVYTLLPTYIVDTVGLSWWALMKYENLNTVIMIIFQLVVAYIISDRKPMRMMALGGTIVAAAMYLFSRVSQLQASLLE